MERFNPGLFTQGHTYNLGGQLLDSGPLGLGFGRQPKAPKNMSDEELLADAVSTLWTQRSYNQVDQDTINERLVAVLTELGERISPIFEAGLLV